MIVFALVSFLANMICFSLGHLYGWKAARRHFEGKL